MWGAYNGEGLGSFGDITELTMFADYLVPVVLHDLGALTFANELRRRITSNDMIPPGTLLSVAAVAQDLEPVQCLEDGCGL